MLKELADFGAATPFQLPELVAASKQLIAFGEPVARLMGDLTTLGDIASGVGIPIGQMAGTFGKVMVAGKLTGETLRQLQEAGVPVAAALAKGFNTTQASIGKMVEAGSVGFAQLRQALTSMDGPGGQFSGMMAKQSQTVAGLMSTLSDSIDMTLAKVATTIVDTFNIRGAIGLHTRGLDSAGGAVVDWVQAASPYLKQFGTAAASAFATVYRVSVPVFEAVASGIRTAWAPVSTFISSHAEAIKSAFGGMASVLVSMGLPAMFGAVATAAGVIGGAVVALGGALLSPIAGAMALGAAVGVLVDHFGLVGKVATLAADAATYVGNHWRGMVDVVATAGAGVYSVAAGAFTAVSQMASTVWWGVSQLVQGAWTRITAAAAAAGASLGGLFGKMNLHVQGFGEIFTAATAGAGYAMAHMGEVSQLVGVTVAANLVDLGNRVQYTLTTVVPAYVQWFATNTINVFRDLASNAGTVFENLSGNVVGVMSNLPGLISGSVHFGDVWHSLTDGFRASYSELPKIAQQQASPLAQALRDQQKELQDRIGGGMAGAIKKQQDQAAAAAAKTKDMIAGTFAKELPAPKIAKPDDVKVKPVLDPAAMTLGITPELKRPKALMAGSAEAFAARYDAGTVRPVVGSAGPAPIAPQMGGAGPSSAPPAIASAAPAAPAAASPAAPLQPEPPRAAATRAYATLQDAERTARGATDTRTKVAAQKQVQVAQAAFQQAQRGLRPPTVPAAAAAPITPAVASADPKMPQPVTGYGKFGRTELTDAAPTADGLFATRSRSTGMQATLTPDMLANLKMADREGRPSAGPRSGTPLQPRPPVSDSIATWRAGQMAAPDSVAAYKTSHPDAFTQPVITTPRIADVLPPGVQPGLQPTVAVPQIADVLPPGLSPAMTAVVPPPPPEPKPSSPGMKTVSQEVADRAGAGAVQQQKKSNDFLAQIATNTRAPAFTLASI